LPPVPCSLRIEGEGDGKDDHAHDQRDDDQRKAGLDVVHELVSAGADDHRVGGHSDRSGVSAGAADDAGHEDCSGIRSHALGDGEADRSHQCCCRRVGHEVRHRAAQDQYYEGQHVRGRVRAERADHLVRDHLACACLLQRGCQGKGAAEEEDGLEVDGLERVFLGDDAGQDQEDRADTSRDTELDADLIFKDHAQERSYEDDQGERLLPLGNAAEVLGVVKYGAVVGRIVVGKEPEADGRVEQDAGCQDRKSDDRVLEEAKRETDLFECALRDHVAGSADQGEVAAHGCREDKGHQEAGALESRLGGDADDHGDQDRCGPCIGEDAAHQSYDHHDRDDEASLGLGELRDDAADLVCHARLKQGAAYDEHRDEQDDVAVNETGKRGLDIEDFGDDKAHTHDH